MSIIPSIFGGRRSDVYDPFSLDIFDPFRDFPFPSSSNSLSVPLSEFANETAAFANTRIDWRETPEAHVFKADLPGLKKEEVKVEVEEGKVLQISGERSKEKEEKDDTWHRMERSSGKFLRRFRLPENAKVEQVKAAMENGVLTVTVPKEEVKKAEVKSIEISGNSVNFHIYLWIPFPSLYPSLLRPHYSPFLNDVVSDEGGSITVTHCRSYGSPFSPFMQGRTTGLSKDVISG